MSATFGRPHGGRNVPQDMATLRAPSFRLLQAFSMRMRPRRRSSDESFRRGRRRYPATQTPTSPFEPMAMVAVSSFWLHAGSNATLPYLSAAGPDLVAPGSLEHLLLARRRHGRRPMVVALDVQQRGVGPVELDARS